MKYYSNINDVKKGSTFVLTNKNYNLIQKALKINAKVICDINVNDKNVKKVNNPLKYLNKKLLKENKKLCKYTNIILLIGYKYKNEVADLTYKYLINKKEKVILLKNNSYYVNKKLYNLNYSANIEIINKLLNIAKEKNINYFIIAINNTNIKNNYLKNLSYRLLALTDFIGNDYKFIEKEIKKTNDLFIINYDDVISKYLNFKRKKTITIGENGIINIDLENNSFEYEYNNYKIKNNIKNIYSYIFAYAILTYLGYDINNIIKKC